MLSTGDNENNNLDSIDRSLNTSGSYASGDLDLVRIEWMNETEDLNGVNRKHDQIDHEQRKCEEKPKYENTHLLRFSALELLQSVFTYIRLTCYFIMSKIKQMVSLMISNLSQKADSFSSCFNSIL